VLIQALLDYGNVSQVAIHLRTVSLQQAVDRVLARLAEQIAIKKAEIEVRRPLPDVPADARILERVIDHLVDNALKFVAAGTAPSVRISAETLESRVRLWVEDEGLGVEPEYQQRIFGAFETLDPAGAYDGTGIGLAIVKQGMERMGADAGVESEPGKGSRFWIGFAAA